MDQGYDRIAGKVRPVAGQALLGQFARDVDGVGHQVLGEDDGKPDVLVLTAVTDVARTLLASVTVADWLKGNMFVSDTIDRGTLNELDRAAMQEIDALTDVCRRPHDRLDSTTELVRAALVRRVPPRGLTRLASHPEDWAGVEHGRIHPHRLVSQRYVEYLDFYENRVAAKLVDRLREYLSRRIRELTTLAEGLADLGEYQRALEREQSWRRLERLSRLVATAVSDTTGPLSLVQESLAELVKVRTSVLRLRDSPAYKHANRRARVPLRLMRTNLFNNEGRYRRVGFLWDQWAVSETRTKELQRDTDRSFLESYDAYVTALTIRACGVLGFVPLEQDSPVPTVGAKVRLSGPGGELVCGLDKDGAVRIMASEKVLVRVVAIGHDLSAAAPESVVQARVDRLDDACAKSPTPLIVAYPGLRSGRAALPGALRKRVHSIGLRAGPGGRTPELAAVVPVTPLEIEGEERLARALRWAVFGVPMVRLYPPTFSVRDQHVELGARWFRTVGRGGDLEVLQRPSVTERNDFVQSFASARERGRSLAAVQEIADLVDACSAQFNLLETCPLCKGSATEFEPRARSTFQSHCKGCETSWGIRICGPCGQRYPTLWPKNAVVDAYDEDRLDMTAGADLLALPCPTATPGTRFRCPWCMQCAGMPRCGCAFE